MILLDTSGILAAIDSSQTHHEAAAGVILGDPGPMLLSPFILAELDYLLATRVSQAAEMAFLAEVARSAYRLEPFDADDIAAAREVIVNYEDLHIGLADASLVVLSARHRSGDVLTLDERHFRTIQTPDGNPFRILPADL